MSTKSTTSLLNGVSNKPFSFGITNKNGIDSAKSLNGHSEKNVSSKKSIRRSGLGGKKRKEEEEEDQESVDNDDHDDDEDDDDDDTEEDSNDDETEESEKDEKKKTPIVKMKRKL